MHLYMFAPSVVYPSMRQASSSIHVVISPFQVVLKMEEHCCLVSFLPFPLFCACYTEISRLIKHYVKQILRAPKVLKSYLKTETSNSTQLWLRTSLMSKTKQEFGLLSITAVLVVIIQDNFCGATYKCSSITSTSVCFYCWVEPSSAPANSLVLGYV